jgi:hypothetical protein
MSERLSEAVAARRRSQMVSGLRGLARGPATSAASNGVAGVSVDSPPAFASAAGPLAPVPAAAEERCELCGTTIAADHRHLLHLVERRITCTCEACWGMRAGEGDYRPVGNRTLWLPELDLPDDVWASFQIPIGLAFFMHSTVTACVVAMYPSPAGATESELHFESWARMCQLNPVLGAIERDVEGLIVNRLVEPHVYAIAPIDRCYALTGAVKLAWDGISGGTGVEHAVTRFFDELERDAVAA